MQRRRVQLSIRGFSFRHNVIAEGLVILGLAAGVSEL